MAIVFAVRGDSVNARYSSGGKEGTVFNGGYSVAADATALSGSSIQAAANNSVKSLVWAGRKNTPNGRAISICVRIKPGYAGTPSASRPLFPYMFISGSRVGRFEINHLTTSGNVSAIITNDSGSTILNTSFGAWSPASDTWYDVVFTWDGTNTADSAKMYIDGVLLGQATPSASLGADWSNLYWSEIALSGGILNLYQNDAHYDEIHFWDEVIDPTSIALESGSGSLNGAARASLISVDSFDGQSYTDPTEALVAEGTDYIFAGVPKTGTYVGVSPPSIVSVVDIVGIKTKIKSALDENNLSSGAPIRDLSANMSSRVQSVFKVNPEDIRPQATLMPCVCIWTDRKAMNQADIAGSQSRAKKRANLRVNIAGLVWNQNFGADVYSSPVDDDLEYLMENIEMILKGYVSLDSKVSWQISEDVTYHTANFNEETHFKVGFLTLNCTVFY